VKEIIAGDGMRVGDVCTMRVFTDGKCARVEAVVVELPTVERRTYRV
jgi:hypothetical protein